MKSRTHGSLEEITYGIWLPGTDVRAFVARNMACHTGYVGGYSSRDQDSCLFVIGRVAKLFLVREAGWGPVLQTML